MAVLLWGGRGQERIVKSILTTQGYTSFYTIQRWNEELEKKYIDGFVIPIGNPHGRKRLELHNFLLSKNIIAINVISENSYIDKNVLFKCGIQISIGVKIVCGTKIGLQCILNTGCSIDHDCVIGNGCEIGPGAVLCGEIILKDNVWIGAGSIVLPRIKIGHNVIIGAGSVVTKNIPSNSIYLGNPARFYKKFNQYMKEKFSNGNTIS
jgi:sugar O-acyltransferase (sialic acid O-acetyltransferase NeuD family)